MSTKTTPQPPALKPLPPEVTLDAIKSASVEQIRRWIRAHGAAAINDVIFERNTKQQK